MTYSSTRTYLEEGYGLVTIRFVAADSYENLYAEDSIEVNVLEPEGVKFELETDKGYMIEDEVNFAMSEAEAETEEDMAAIAFIREADNVDVKRYVALFYEPSSPPTVSQLRIAAVVRPGLQAEDLLWHGDPFGDDPTPLREWKCSAQSWFTNVMDRFSVEQLVNGDEENDVPGLSEGWISTHVLNRRSYSYDGEEPEYPGVGVNFCDLVNLNFILKELADNLHDALLANEIADIDFSFSATRTDFFAVPCKWNALSFEVGGMTWNTLYVENPIGWEIGHHRFELPTAQGLPFILGLTSGGQDGTFTYPYVDFKRFKTGDFDIPDFGIGSYMIPKKVKTYTDLLYAVAEAFNCFLGLKFISHTELSIKFIPRTNVAGDKKVCMRDVTKASLDTQPIEANSKEKLFSVRAHKLAADGDNYYFSNTEMPEFSANEDGATKDAEAENLLWSVSCTTCRIGGIHYAEGYFDWASLPHNAAFCHADGSLDAPNERTRTVRGNTTALFMHVQLFDIDPPFVETHNYFTNVGAIAYWDRITNQLVIFNTLPDYLNSQRAIAKAAYQFEYSVDVPFLYGFRRLQDGSHEDDNGGKGSWKNMEIGRRCDIDGNEFVVTGFQQKFGDITTSVKLRKTSRYSFSSIEAPELPGGGTPEYPVIQAPIPARRPRTLPPGVEEYYAAAEIFPGQAVISTDTDRYVESATTIAVSYERVIGIAISYAATGGEIVRIAKPGARAAVFPEDTFTAGLPVYLADVEPGNINLSNVPIVPDPPGVVYHLQVGVSDTTASVLVAIKRGWLYSEGGE